jgi:hypothetical protein
VVAGESSASSSGLMATVGSSVSSVLDRLRSLYKEQPLGTVAHRYTVSGLLSYMQLARHLKPASQMSDVLADSADIFFGDAGSDLITKLGNKEIPMPSISLLRDSRLRLDLLSVAFQEKWFSRWQTLHYELVDSSPQLGLNFLAVIEDVIRIPESCSLNIILRLQHDVGSNWQEELQCFSSLGVGRAGKVKKTMSCANLVLMSVANLDDFNNKRCRYRGTGSDLGQEHGIVNMPVDVVPALRGKYNTLDPMSFLYPEALGVATALHILWGGFEYACKSSEVFQSFIDTLTWLQDFTSDKQLMRKMRAECCSTNPSAAQALKVQPCVHIDWRWGR